MENCHDEDAYDQDPIHNIEGLHAVRDAGSRVACLVTLRFLLFGSRLTLIAQHCIAVWPGCSLRTVGGVERPQPQIECVQRSGVAIESAGVGPEDVVVDCQVLLWRVSHVTQLPGEALQPKWTHLQKGAHLVAVLCSAELHLEVDSVPEYSHVAFVQRAKGVVLVVQRLSGKDARNCDQRLKVADLRRVCRHVLARTIGAQLSADGPNRVLNASCKRRIPERCNWPASALGGQIVGRLHIWPGQVYAPRQQDVVVKKHEWITDPSIETV